MRAVLMVCAFVLTAVSTATAAPAPSAGDEQTGEATWYGPGFDGRRTANGERFDASGLSAAHAAWPLPSLVRVTNLANGREVTVRVNDRPGRGGRQIIDLSRGAAEALDIVHIGRARVTVRYLGPAPSQGN